MPVFRAGAAKTVPPWADFSEWGVSHMPAGQHVDRHYHDSNEFVLIVAGKVTVGTEGAVTELGPGDAVLTEMGVEHAWDAVVDSIAIWATSRLQGQKRPGHLFK